MSLATRLVSLRKQKGLTQIELAEKLNVSRQAVSRWEVGAAVPSTDNLKVLGELYCVSVDYLLNDNSVCYCSSDETKEIPDNKKSVGHRKWFIIVLCMLITVIIIGGFVRAFLQQKDVDAFPMNDMDIVDENNGYSTETFLID